MSTEDHVPMMSRLRSLVGFTAGGVMVASGLAHSVLGWPAVQAALRNADAPAVAGLAVPWHFAGVAMVTLGALAVLCVLRAVRGEAALLMPVRVVAIAYLLFGAAGLVLIRPDPTFLLFLVPGAMLLFTSR
ncbi:MAG: hypothetical protein HY275_02375 [Gemmatimonadetes bacterium]|nr:hypothetical protein [Gemmatimonadota bacterium]